MKAAILEEIGKISYREDYPRPIPGPDDALVRVHYCGVCGSDVTNFRQGLYKIPLIMGHEIAGEIVELGANIADFKVGDIVLGINVLLDVTGEFRGLGVFQDGGFAEYVKVPKEFLFHATDRSLEENALVESYALVARAIKLSRIEQNENIMILGGGSLGLVFLDTLLITKEPRYVVVVEPHEFLRGKARELGATEVLSPKKSEIRKYTQDMGSPKYIFDCAGTDKTFQMALDLVKRGGSIILEGLYRGNVTFPLMMMNSKEICLQGVMGHDRSDILEAINLYKNNLVHPSKLISAIVPLKDIQKVLEKYLDKGERKFIKHIVKI